MTSLAVDGNSIYAAGSFTSADGAVASRIARWNGTDWQGLNTLSKQRETISHVGVTTQGIVVGGSFRSLGGVAATNLARWNGDQSGARFRFRLWIRYSPPGISYLWQASL